MKNITLILVVALTVQTALAQGGSQTPPLSINLKELCFNGKIKEITESIYVEKTNDPTPVLRRKKIMEFDMQGAEKEEYEYDSKGILLSKTIYNYSDRKNVTGNQYAGNDFLVKKFTLKFDDNGKLIETNQFLPAYPSTEIASKYKYAGDGYLDEIQVLGPHGFLISKTIVSNNRAGQKTKMTESDMRNNVTNTINYNYDSTERLIEKEIKSNLFIKSTELTKYVKFDSHENCLEEDLEQFMPPVKESIGGKRITKRTFMYY